MLAFAAAAHAEPVPDTEMKAAFVFNFAVFTEWPQEALAPGAPINVCVGASGALAAALAQLNDKLVNGHRIAVVPPSPVRACHLLVLGSADRERWGQLRRELAGSSVLTVSDDRAISADGAMIGLSVENRRIGFDVDLAAARGARLVLSSKLLRLARNLQ